MTKTIFLKYGKHTLRGNLQPDGRLLICAKDTIRVLCRINGVSMKTMDRMPEASDLNDYSWAFHTILNEVRDRPETKAFGQWLGEQTAKFETKGGLS